MNAEDPKSRPEPPPGPSVYGGQWGEGGNPNADDAGKPDRPGKIEPPPEPQGSGNDGPTDTHGER